MTFNREFKIKIKRIHDWSQAGHMEHECLESDKHHNSVVTMAP